MAGTLRGGMAGINDESRIVEEVEGITGESMFLTRGILVQRPVVATTVQSEDLHSSINDALGAEPEDIDIQDFNFNPQGIELVATLTPAPIALDPDPTGVPDPQPWGVMDFQIQTYPNPEGAYDNPGGFSQWVAVDDEFFIDFGGDFDWGYGGYGGFLEAIVFEAMDDTINEALVGRLFQQEINMDEQTLFSARGQFLGRYDGSDMSMSATGVGTWFDTDLEGLFYWGDPFGETASLYSYDLAPVGFDWGYVGIGLMEPHIRLGVVMGAASYVSGGPGSDAFMWRTLTSDAVPGSGDLFPGEPRGFSGGIWKQGIMDGISVGLVEDFQGSITSFGITVGDVVGGYFENIDEEDTVAFLADSILVEVPVTSLSGAVNLTQVRDTTDFEQLAENGGNIMIEGILSSEVYFQTFPDFGVWESYMHGTGLDSDQWIVRLIDEDPPFGVSWVQAYGTRNTVKHELSGKAAGAWVEFDTTGVIGGEIKGTFNPNNWQAVVLGSYLETTQFMTMVGTEVGREQLKQLDIPAVEIGRTSLSYENFSAETLQSVNMNDVVFFAHSAGADPRVFATSDVNGTFAAPPLPGHSVNLTGAHGVSADFTINTFGISQATPWDASVRGGGTYTGTGGMTTTQPIWMEGGAAGEVGTSNTFTGTAAGVAGTGTNPYPTPAP